ncbi:NAD(P)/FAD-dependent oxidoreductase [Microbacterium gorillae]|uniref:NAD(P)/FAD-dependent oxidoreductase n=1 Tax=Microbacterium gorillae TaxID=1231063 RepID=UPI000590091A|nr:NAD(P)/FAD-dependent oxidoreductase [Microbacterium gorillae]
MTAERIPDLAVIGAGPAGLSAADIAAEHGLDVVLVDAGSQTGGQFWRHPDERHLAQFRAPESTGHHHWKRYVDLRSRLAAAVQRGAVRHLSGRHVWRVDVAADLVHLRTTASIGTDQVPATERTVTARRLVLATGAYDRQLPIPGWTLPGAMAAGGVQALLKSNQVAAGRRAVVAGTGPFLMSVAAGLAEAGVEVLAICEANSYLRWARTPLRAVQEPGKLFEGVEYARTFLRHRVPLKMRTVVTAIRGTGRVQQVEIAAVDGRGRVRPGTERTVEADLVALGWGFTPQLELAIGLGLDTTVDVDDSLVVVADDRQRTSHPLVYAAGEATGIGGAVQSCAEGELAALAVAAELGRTVEEAALRRRRRRIDRGRRFAVGMHRAGPVPPEWSSWVTPTTTVCRCEEVTAGEVAASVCDLGADDARDVRVTSRPGMGLCQGRVCGFGLAQLVTAHTGRPATAAELESIAKRNIGVPITLGEIADLVPLTAERADS